MLISISCWGDWHTKVFIEHGLPSLVPQMEPHDTLLLHTDMASHERLMPHLPDACDVDYWPGRHLAKAQTSGKLIQASMWLKDFQAAQKRREIVALLWPDVVYGSGTLAHWRALLSKSKLAIFQHFPRVVWETAEPVLKAATSHRDLARLAIRHEHPIMKAHYFGAPRFPDHAELVTWRTPAGIMTRLMGAAPVVADPMLFDLDGRTLLVQAPGNCMAVVQDSDDAIGLSLAPGDYSPDWAGEGPFTIERAREWQSAWGAPCNQRLAATSYRIHDGDATSGDWYDTEMDADAIMDGVFDRSDVPAIAAE